MASLDKEILSVKDITSFLEDRVFVDYFNVFLSLPIFSQKLLFKFSKENFELDPPLPTKTNVVLENNKLIRWLLDERIPFFRQSQLYFDYKLNCKLRETKLKLSKSSHNIYREIEYLEKIQFENEYLDFALGNVLGMCRFREFLSGTPGETVLQFWIDVEQMKSTLDKSVHRRLWLWRELQHKYFKIGGLIQLKDNQMWNVLRDGSAVLEKTDQRIRGVRADEDSNDHFSLQELQDAVLAILKKYWLHKYFLHIKDSQTRLLTSATVYHNSCCSNENLKENIQTINIGLKVAQGKSVLQPETPQEKREGKWTGLFSPQMDVNDSFMSKREDVVTVHDDGEVSVGPADPDVMDKTLQKYANQPQFLESLPERPNNADLSNKILSAEAAKKETHYSFEKTTKNQISVRPRTPERPKHKTIQGFVNANQDYLKGFMEGFSTSLLQQPTKQIIKRQIERSSLPEQRIILPKIELKVQPNKGDLMRPKSKVKTQSVVLPPVEGHCTETCVQEAMFASKQHRVSPIMWESTAVLSSFRTQKTIFVCAITADQLAGGPFEAFLQRTDNPYAIKSMHFWHESIVYLSTKYNTTPEHYDRVRLQRAKQLMLHHLDVHSTEQLNLPSEVTEKLLRLLPADRGDHLLRCAQDSVITILEKAWKLFTKVDRMIFNKNCLQGRKRTILKKILALTDTRKEELMQQAQEKEKATTAAQKSKEPPPRSPTRQRKEKKPKGPSTKVYSLASGTLSTGARRQSIFKPRNIEEREQLVKSPEKESAKQRKDSKQSLIDKIIAGEEIEETNEDGRKNKRIQSAVAKKIGKKSTSKQLITMLKAREKQKEKKKKRRTSAIVLEKIPVSTNVSTPPPVVLDEAELNSFKATAERRMWRALYLTLCICRIDCDGLPGIEPLALNDLEFDPCAYGSLYVKPLTVVRAERPLKFQKFAKPRKRVKARKEAEEPSAIPVVKQPSAQAKKEEDPMLKYETLPVFARPYRNLKDGRWVVRPNKAPKSMMDIFLDAQNLEFFKRYMQFTGKDMPLLLWEAVEQLKYIKEAKARHQHVAYTFKKFFLNKNNFAALDCKSDVLLQMTLMDKMTPALLLSAQSVIAKDIEIKWFEPYTLTFPENEGTTESTTSSTKETSSVSTTSTEKERVFARKAKDWAKAKAGVVHTVRMREQWKRVARIINRFRKGLWDPNLCDQFIEYLNRRIAAEYQKYREQKMRPSSNRDGHTVVRKVIKDKVIDMTRLPGDVRFLCETERYRKLCDAATEAAIAGTYGVADHAIIERKAALIVECFIESEIVPSIQINISPELATTIVSCYQGGMLDRTLFHEATMAVYPHVIYLWQRFLQGLSTGVMTNTDTSGYKYWSNKHSDLPIDFFNLFPKRMRKQCDDDYPRLQFSLMHGLRLLLPTSHYYNHSGSLEELFPELVREILEGHASGKKDNRATASPRETPGHTNKEQEQYKKIVTKVKVMLANRRNAVVRANNKAGLGRKKEVEVKEELDADFKKPGVHVRPKPFKSASSL